MQIDHGEFNGNCKKSSTSKQDGTREEGSSSCEESGSARQEGSGTGQEGSRSCQEGCGTRQEGSRSCKEGCGTGQEGSCSCKESCGTYQEGSRSCKESCGTCQESSRSSEKSCTCQESSCTSEKSCTCQEGRTCRTDQAQPSGGLAFPDRSQALSGRCDPYQVRPSNATDFLTPCVRGKTPAVDTRTRAPVRVPAATPPIPAIAHRPPVVLRQNPFHPASGPDAR